MRYRLVVFGSEGVEWADYATPQQAYDEQDRVIDSLHDEGFGIWVRPLFEKGKGYTYQWVEVHLVYAESGVAL